jgi:outer membrane protein assembly factor BamE (lipoprotein component of BamABCDE complex)
MPGYPTKEDQLRLRAVAVLAAVAAAGCGGDDSEGTQQAQQGTTEQQATRPEKLEGARTRENVLRTLGLTKKGDAYDFGFPGCSVVAVAITKDEVKKLEGEVNKQEQLVKNESGSAAVQLAEVKYFCSIHAATELRRIP